MCADVAAGADWTSPLKRLTKRSCRTVIELGPNQNQKMSWDLGLLRSRLRIVVTADEPVTVYVTNDNGVWCFEHSEKVEPMYAYAKDIMSFDRHVRVPRASSVSLIVVNHDKEHGRKVRVWRG